MKRKLKLNKFNSLVVSKLCKKCEKVEANTYSVIGDIVSFNEEFFWNEFIEKEIELRLLNTDFEVFRDMISNFYISEGKTFKENVVYDIADVADYIEAYLYQNKDVNCVLPFCLKSEISEDLYNRIYFKNLGTKRENNSIKNYMYFIKEDAVKLYKSKIDVITHKDMIAEKIKIDLNTENFTKFFKIEF